MAPTTESISAEEFTSTRALQTGVLNLRASIKYFLREIDLFLVSLLLLYSTYLPTQHTLPIVYSILFL